MCQQSYEKPKYAANVTTKSKRRLIVKTLTKTKPGNGPQNSTATFYLSSVRRRL